jgi:hypothetical protein
MGRRPPLPGSVSGDGGKRMRASPSPVTAESQDPNLTVHYTLSLAMHVRSPSQVRIPMPLLDTHAVVNDRTAHLVGAGVVERLRLVTVVVSDTGLRDGPDARSRDAADDCVSF